MPASAVNRSAVNRLDRTHPLPLWAQLEADLRRRLAEGEFAARFPTDMELVEEYGVSRHTVRDAVGRLCDEGLLERRRGLGTVVRSDAFDQPLGTLYSLFRSIEDRGVTQRSEVRDLDERSDAAAAHHLGLPADAPLVVVERLRFAGNEPLAIDRSWLPAALAAPLLEVDFRHTALYDELAAHCGVHPAGGWERIVPVVPDAQERLLLSLGPDVAAFSIERLAHDARGRSIEWRESLVRGDRYGFVAEWSVGGASDVALGPLPASP